MTSLSLYSLLNNYLHHGSNPTSITSAILTVRDILLPTKLIPPHSSSSTGGDVNSRKRKRKLKRPAFSPTYITKEHSEAIYRFATPLDTIPKSQQQQQQQENNHHRHQGLFSPVTPRYRAPRAPIVLCHGLYGFDRMGPEILPSLQVHYWNGIEKALCDLGAKVIVTRVPKSESIANRAYALHSILSSFMSNKEINFIGHSMGGLDCRHLLSHIKERSYHVNSLTTICTPHRGSPVMDWLRDRIGVGHYPTSTMVASGNSNMVGDLSTTGFLRRSGDANDTNVSSPLFGTAAADADSLPPSPSSSPQRLLAQWLDTPAFSNLTTDYCTQHFNPSTPDDPSVAYYSYTAKSSPSHGYWSNLLDLPGHLVQQVEGDNDGVVSVDSGRWGQHVKTIEDADHWDFTGKSMVPYRWKSKTGSDFDRTEFYVELANHLYEEGH
ncbi:Alpha/Beta hydrolase protein [Absidia repens]|uniref:GPI inositol-deacylase n=1 Tax=Absidia repens TaxID=90262 RepID=A0A1X2HKI6_9FUNG|nr:Alpha/Beta hydrolase protein [Absidia repens]